MHATHEQHISETQSETQTKHMRNINETYVLLVGEEHDFKDFYVVGVFLLAGAAKQVLKSCVRRKI